MRSRPATLAALAAVLLLGGCEERAGRTARPSAAASSPYGADYPGPNEIHFKEDVVSNSEPGNALLDLEFVDQSAQAIGPKNFLGKKNLVLVMTRGNTGYICPYCSTYTSSLIANYAQIAKRDAEVLLVYPIERRHQSGKLNEFLQETFRRSKLGINAPPFPVVLDVELKGVDSLGLRKDLSKPATYVIDKQGQIRFAYVGSSHGDRPAISVILKQLDAIQQRPG